MRRDELGEEFAIDRTPIWPDEDGRLEPIFLAGPLWIDFEEAEPVIAALPPEAAEAALLVGFEEFALLDPEPGADEPDEPLPTPRPRAAATSLAASLVVHLLTLLVLVGWSSAPVEIGGAIPVQLVLEGSSGAPPEQPPGQSVAESADRKPPADSPAGAPPSEPTPNAPTPSEPPPETQVASVPQPTEPTPPPPSPPAKPIPTPAHKPAPASEPRAMPKPIRPPVRPPVPTPKQIVATVAPKRSSAVSVSRPRPASRRGQVSGSAGGGGDYFAYLEQLTRPYLYMLSPAFLAGRRGTTTLSIEVSDDGTVRHISVKRSSGYPDIDARIEQMVAAVGRFPPLPQRLRKPGADLDFKLVFPAALKR